MKRFKNISLVYALQITAVLFLFFYPNYPSKAELKAFAINNAVTKKIAASVSVNESPQLNIAKAPVLMNRTFFFLTGTGTQMVSNNQFKTTADEDYKSLRKKYRIDAFSLHQIQNMHVQVPGRAVDSNSK